MSKQLTVYRRYVSEQIDHASYREWAVYFLNKTRAENFRWHQVYKMCELTVAEALDEMTVKAFMELLLTGQAMCSPRKE